MRTAQNVPVQKGGMKMDTVCSARTHTSSEALQLFKDCSIRLLDVNNWNKLCGVSKKIFYLAGPDGMPKEGPAKTGDYIVANLPAPPSQTISGNDWDLIEHIETINTDYRNLLSMQVRPVRDPRNKEKGTAHFFNSETTNTFSVERKSLEITVSIRGRNEHLNEGEAPVFYNKVRNMVVGVFAWLGGSKIMWKTLAHGILHGAK
jgi:hypothetical protein